MMSKSIQQIKILNVGHGDSSVVYLLSEEKEIEHTVIIDIPDSLKLYTELEEQMIKTVDLIIITHTDADHCRGLSDFIERFSKVGSIKKLCFNIDRNIPTKTLGLMLKRVMEYKKILNIILEPGAISTEIHERRMIEYNGTELSIVYPDLADVTQAYMEKNTNDMSIVCLLKNTSMQMLFTGDLGSKGWDRLLTKNSTLACTIIKMPHHGAFYESGENVKGSEDIIECLKPEVAIISSGQNKKYNHPDKRTIEMLKNKGIKIYCTQYTKMCNGGICEELRECNGNISILGRSSSYIVEPEFNTILKSPACNT